MWTSYAIGVKSMLALKGLQCVVSICAKLAIGSEVVAGGILVAQIA